MRWWRTEKPGVLQSMGSQRVGHDWDWTTTRYHVPKSGMSRRATQSAIKSMEFNGTEWKQATTATTNFIWLQILQLTSKKLPLTGSSWVSECVLCVHMCRCSIVSNSLQPHGLQPTRLLCSWNFPVRLSFPTPGDLPDSGIEPMSPALAGKFTTTVPPGKLKCQRTATITPKALH